MMDRKDEASSDVSSKIVKGMTKSTQDLFVSVGKISALEVKHNAKFMTYLKNHSARDLSKIQDAMDLANMFVKKIGSG